MEVTSPRPAILPTVGGHAARQRKNAAATGERSTSPNSADETTLPALMQRASNAARQMRYFGLVAKRTSFSELVPSATRAGFTLLNEDRARKEATFRWSAGEPDFIFSVSLNDAARASIVAESRGDLFGLILTGLSHAPTISVETNPAFENNALGRKALLFRDILLMFPDFDDLPAWTKCPEPDASKVASFHWEMIFDFASFRRGGLAVAIELRRRLKLIASQVSTTCSVFQDRWRRPR